MREAGMQAVCELPQSGSGETMAYVACAVIGMVLTRGLGWCADDDDDEGSDHQFGVQGSDPPSEKHNRKDRFWKFGVDLGSSKTTHASHGR